MPPTPTVAKIGACGREAGRYPARAGEWIAGHARTRRTNAS